MDKIIDRLAAALTVNEEFRRVRMVDSSARRVPPPADLDVADAHGRTREQFMQHQQHPLLSAVRDPEPLDAADRQREALEDLQALCERHLSRLDAADEWRPAFVRLSLAASRSLEQPALRLLRHQLG